MKRIIQRFIESLDLCPDTIVSTPFADYITVGKVLIYFYTKDYSNLSYCGERYHELLRKRVEHNGQIFCMVSDYELKVRSTTLKLLIYMANNGRRRLNSRNLAYQSYNLTHEIIQHSDVSKEILFNDNRNGYNSLIMKCKYNHVTNTIYDLRFSTLINEDILKKALVIIKEEFNSTNMTFITMSGLESHVIKELLKEASIEYKSSLKSDFLWYSENYDEKRTLITKEIKENLIKEGKIENIIPLVSQNYINIHMQ